MSTIQNLILENMIRAYEKLSQLSQVFTFVETDRTQRFESEIPYGLFNSVFTYKRSEEINPADEMESIKSLYHNRGQKLAWVTTSHQQDEVINQALATNHFNQVGVISGMGLSLKGWRSDLPEMPGLEVRAIREPQEIEEFRKVMLAGYNVPEPMADIFCKVFVDGPNQDPTTVQHYLAYVDGVPVTTLTTFIEGDVAGFYSIATLEAYRSRGLARTMLAHVLHIVQQKGVKLAVIHATPMGRSVYPKVGFKEELTINIFSS
ncbi:GNAT family N-acetyltransferase [Paenibacillus qinlingensis]|uniref:GNAT family N-acetyltransferase n=1 Tax=Paenibacillus qinlingensis TaxID=1837343 RepID=UPI001564CAF9|nr:GNAT family N-acetyltransferase [Paenibacillus qinlingensis]NQX61129.1 GNAT family N-acetyltransferase [Paenibacillus qinlingensis]